MKNKKGSFSIELCLISAIFVPLFIACVLGAFSFFNVSAFNSNLNFDTGRYVASCGCSFDRLKDSFTGRKFANYAIIYETNGDPLTSVVIKDGPGGSIIINCPSDAHKGSEFSIISSIDTNATIFPSVDTKRNYYVQEVD